jgi:tRNA(fMet)-specific endonuclease VapC
MKYLLDTNICIYLINGKFDYLIDRIQSHGIETVGISTITIAELEFGIAKSDIEFRDRNRDALFEFLLPFSILDFDTRAAFEYGNIRADLSNRGEVIGNMDMLIGSQARALDLILVTNNLREFQRIPQLAVENWVR